MSLALYSRFETAAAPLYMNCYNNAYEDPRQFVSNAVLDGFDIASQVYMPGISDWLWRNNFSDARSLTQKCHQEHSLVRNHSADIENLYPCEKQWTEKAIPSLNLDVPEDNYELDSRNSKIWRPFSPSPSRPNEAHVIEESASTERKKSIKNCYNIHHTITPSRVKIEPSKSSVFKPFKKKSYSCSHCSMNYLTSAQLMSHMRVHIGSKPYRCEFPNCFKTFSRKEELTRHRRIHSGYKPHLCTVCGKTFGRKDHLGKHLKTHLQVSEKKIYICRIPGCGHRYTRSDALTRHKSTAHSIHKSKTRMGNRKQHNDEELNPNQEN